MADMLVKLYNLENDWSFINAQKEKGITIRKPFGPEKMIIVDWVLNQFHDAWASETSMAIHNTPISCFIALKGSSLIGFGCYDATALGYFGPLGIAEPHRGSGTGKALLLACLLDMKLKGYGYAIIGDTSVYSFYQKACGAVEIPDSKPGIWNNWLYR